MSEAFMMSRINLIRVLVLAGAFACLSSLGQTRTLFIDFNNAEGEIQVFRESVPGKAGEVVVLPSYERITPKQRTEARQANTRIEKYTERAKDCATKAKPESYPCHGVYGDIRQAELARIAATGDYSADDLKTELLSLGLGHADKAFDILVVSGHHEAGYFSGELTQAKERELASLFGASGLSRLRFDTVILLGCSTGTKNAYVEYLAPLFPEAALIFGAENSAPIRDEARNLAFIRKLVVLRPKLLRARSGQEIEPIYRTLLSENWPVSLLWRKRILFFARHVEPF
jgi:hypothetical protein